MNKKRVSYGLRKANAAFNAAHPGELSDRQPVHTVYGGAHLFRHDTAIRLGKEAIRTLEQFAPSAAVFGEILSLGKWSESVYARVKEKLAREPVEDFRIDFEDGYGTRPDAEEDGHAKEAALQAAEGMRRNSLPPFIGIRLKPLNLECAERSVRTLDLFLTTLTGATRQKLPSGFILTLAKITIAEQVSEFAKHCAHLETKLKLPKRSLLFEIMIETPTSVLDPKGNCALPGLISASNGRCAGAHFGTYDYTASLGITASYQGMTHPACDFAKQMMRVSLAGTGVRLSDGATNVIPVGNREDVHRAWKLHYDQVRHSLRNGYYQGWDLHPAQLPTRYAAVYAFFLESLEAASARLKAFVEKAAKASLVGDVFDDAATGQALLNYFLRGLNCGAITEKEALSTGLTLGEIRGRSFAKILEARSREAVIQT